MQYWEDVLFDAYANGDYIDPNEMAYGLNNEIDDRNQTPPWQYGYFFAPYRHADVNDALRTICTWVDFPVDFYNYARSIPVPKEGHPNHVPVAVPCFEDFENWMAIRGIHSNRTAWYYHDALTIYGFWVNDPDTNRSDSFGGNSYKTVDTFTSRYYKPITVPGDYFGQYVAVTDPPYGIEAPEQAVDITFGQAPVQFSARDAKVVQRAALGIGPNTLGNLKAQEAARNAVWDVIQFDEILIDAFENTVPGKVVYNGDSIIVYFNGPTSFEVEICKANGQLLEFALN
jgi:hypothetical protein